jgi:hypothetical protein
MVDAQVKAREGRGARSLLKRIRDGATLLQCRASGLPMKISSCCDAL